MSMLLDISGEMLRSSTARAARNDENRDALDEIRQTLKTLSIEQGTSDPALHNRLASLDSQLTNTYEAVREEGRASAQRDRVTHIRLGWVAGGVLAVALLFVGGWWAMHSGQQASDAKLAESNAELAKIQQLLETRLSPKPLGQGSTQQELPPELIEQAKLLLERGNREQQALAQIALKQHAEAERIIQELKKDAAGELFRVLTLEGDNWYNALEYDRAIQPYEQALALRPNDVWAHNKVALAHSKTQAGDTFANRQSAAALWINTLKLTEPKSPDWAEMQNNLGVAMSGLGESVVSAAGTQYLSIAIEAFRAALDVYAQADLPKHWARVQINLSNTLLMQVDRAEASAALQLLLLRPCEVLSDIANATILKVAQNALRVLLQHRHMLVGSFA